MFHQSQGGLTAFHIALAHDHLDICKELEPYSTQTPSVPEADTVPSTTSEHVEEPPEPETEDQSKTADTVPPTTSEGSEESTELKAEYQSKIPDTVPPATSERVEHQSKTTAYHQAKVK